MVKIKTRWQNRHVDNCGFYENDKCCKIREFGKDSSKVWENCRLIISENIKFGENGQSGKNFSKVWQKWKQDDKRRMSLTASFYEDVNFCEINKFLEKSIKGLAKFRWDDKNGHLVQIMTIRKWQIQGDKGKFRQKWRVCQNSSKVWPNIQMEWQKVACWQLAILTRMTNLAKIATFARSNEWLAKWHGEKWSIGN